MEAIILAGGFVTRLATMVSDVPKPMAPVGGVPFLQYLMDYLLKHPQIREELERQAKKRYCDEFSFEKLKTAYIELYKEIG